MTHDVARPVLTVLCGPEAPPSLTTLAQRMDVRFTDSAGLSDAMPGSDVVLLWDFVSPALRDAWQFIDRLQWIHIAAAGVDTLLFDALVDSSVTITNARGVFERPIAEFVLMSVLMHAKDAVGSRLLQGTRTWRHRETETVVGRNVLVLGTGPIGRETARLLRAIGMQVRGAGRVGRSDDPDFGTVIASADLREYVGWADYLVIAAPLTNQTRGVVDRTVLCAMKSSAYLINVGRGPCVVENDLLAALNEERIAGAALDVFENEPLPADHPLWDAPGVTVSAHMSGDTIGWCDRLESQFVDNAQRWLEDRPLFNVVDKQLGYIPGE